MRRLLKLNDTAIIDQLVTDYVRRGKHIDRSDYIAEHPEFATRLAAALPRTDVARSAGHATVIDRASLGDVSENFFGKFNGRTSIVGGDIDHYTIVSELGRGAMGTVYRAIDKRDKSHVAIKTLQAGGYTSPSQLDRFVREGAAQANLTHPNIAAVRDTGHHNSVPYIVMELITGGATLQSILEDSSEPFNQRRAATVVRDLALALAYSHEHGIIHRDVKPSNILMDGAVPKLTDFGLAFVEGNNARLTRSGEMIGTICYMSPEQARATDEPNPQWDIYSVGATLYELLTGQPPFVGETQPEILAKVINNDVVSIEKAGGKVSCALEAICIKCLEKNVDNRYNSARELADDLDRFLSGREVLAPLIHWLWRRTHRTLVRRRIALSIFLAAVILGMNSLYLGRRIANQKHLVALQSTGGRINTEQFSTRFLLWALKSGESDRRVAAVTALSTRKDPGIDSALTKLTTDPDRYVRLQLARCLANQPRPTATAICRALITDSHEIVVAAAVKAAEQLGDPALLPDIQRAALHRNSSVARYAMMTALRMAGSQGDKFARTFLYQADWPARGWMLDVIANGAVRPELPLLFDALGNSANKDEQQQIHDLLRSCTGAECGPLPAAWQGWWSTYRYRWDVRHALVISGADRETGLRARDIVWQIDGAHVDMEFEWPMAAGTEILIARDGQFRSLTPGAGASQAHRCFIGTIDSEPVGNSSPATRLRACGAAATISAATGRQQENY
ncbi:MAG: protein kinase domain-containing protein [Lentisphaeria bacterium]